MKKRNENGVFIKTLKPINCLFCKNRIEKPTRLTTKFCSHKCYSNNKVGEKHSWGYKIGDALRGIPKSPEHIANVVAKTKGKPHMSMRGTNHFAWKGDKAHYDSIHDWVKRYKGNPKKCEHCLLNDLNRMYHWANISGEYKRNLDDWLRLCVPCHSKMDKGRNSMQYRFKKNTQ